MRCWKLSAFRDFWWITNKIAHLKSRTTSFELHHHTLIVIYLWQIDFQCAYWKCYKYKLFYSLHSFWDALWLLITISDMVQITWSTRSVHTVRKRRSETALFWCRVVDDATPAREKSTFCCWNERGKGAKLIAKLRNKVKWIITVKIVTDWL